MKKILIPIIIVVLLGGGIGGYFLFSKSSKASADSDEKQEVVHPTETVELPEFIVNLADKGRPHYVKATIVVEVTGPESHEKVKEATPYIRDKMLTTLSRQEYQNLLTQEGKENLKAELLRCAQEIFDREEGNETKATAILFTNFVMD